MGTAPGHMGGGPGLGLGGVQEEITGIAGELILRGPSAGWVGRKALYWRMEGAEHKQNMGGGREREHL